MFNRLIGLFGNPKRKHVYHDSIECLVAALEARDMYTSGHSNRVADMSYDLAKSLNIKGSHLEAIHIAAHLHDIGKLGIPDNILNKKGKLLPHEWEEIKRHPEIGCHILQKSKALLQVAEIVLHHHEHWDGAGYPAGLTGGSIPLGARIISVADAIDAMVSERPYRSAMTWESCMEEIVLNKGIQFDPAVVEAAQKLWPKWAAAAQNKKEAM